MNDHECKPVEISVESYIETALTEWYGRRCTEHDDPARFAAWAEYDELLRNVQSADAERKQWDHNYATYCQTIADLEQRLAAAEAAARWLWPKVSDDAYDAAWEKWPWLDSESAKGGRE